MSGRGFMDVVGVAPGRTSDWWSWPHSGSAWGVGGLTPRRGSLRL